MTKILKSYNPANGDLVGEVFVTPANKIPSVVAGAHEALDKWSAVSIEDRAVMLNKAANDLLEQADPLGDLLSREMGKPLKRGIGEVSYCGSLVPGKTDEMIEALKPEVNDGGSIESTIYYDPLGVCAVIAPWNYPMSMLQSMVLPALMAGNTVVLKPSEETPLIAQAYVDVLNKYLPEGVLTVIYGTDEQGKALVQADIDLIAFTGSRRAGINILRSASKGLKRVIFELGGKDPLIVLDDADLESAAKMAVDNSFEN